MCPPHPFWGALRGTPISAWNSKALIPMGRNRGEGALRALPDPGQTQHCAGRIGTHISPPAAPNRRQWGWRGGGGEGCGLHCVPVAGGLLHAGTQPPQSERRVPPRHRRDIAMGTACSALRHCVPAACCVRGGRRRVGPFRCWAVMLNKARRRRGLAGGSSSAPLVGTSYCHRPTEATGSFLHAGVLPGFGGDIHPAFNTQHHPYALPCLPGVGSAHPSLSQRCHQQCSLRCPRLRAGSHSQDPVI